MVSSEVEISETYFAKTLYNGLIAASTNITAYQCHSKLSSGAQSFAAIRAKLKTLIFVSEISAQSNFRIFEVIQSVRFIAITL